ncbi:hypothetical protein [Dictyobacter kobayashii]|uniref:Uncharacterized protein n=1 Tax=Dictyobacter kobayashii TaxID=2014872 RepID=A0A402AV49_9CHLR|nr:hypothetical protein [Dictyobacter kobayashii]GCE22964.1 hypothetical protein KDK_67640 [Dictyobacter kobayashii]
MFEDDELDTLRDGVIINRSQFNDDEDDNAPRGITSGNVLRCPRCHRTRGYRPIRVLNGVQGQRCLSCGTNLVQCSHCQQFTILPRLIRNALLTCQHCGNKLA